MLFVDSRPIYVKIRGIFFSDLNSIFKSVSLSRILHCEIPRKFAFLGGENNKKVKLTTVQAKCDSRAFYGGNMSKLDNRFKFYSFDKRAITKEEFADQVIELVESEQSLALSPEAFEFAVGWMYKKYKLGLIESK